MSLSISARYGSRADSPTLDYPTGSFKNKTAPDALDGTPLEKDWANDLLGARDAILAEAGILANGVADTAQASQLLAALNFLYKREMTYAQVSALTEDRGVIFVSDRGGFPWQWVNTGFFTGYRSALCGKLDFGWTPTPLPWQVEAIGGTLNETSHGGLIGRFRESGLVVPLGSWVAGEYKIADMGGGNWKAPDMRNQFLRFTGTNADTANARALGSWQKGSLQPFDPDNGSMSTTGLTHTGSPVNAPPSFHGLDPATVSLYPQSLGVATDTGAATYFITAGGAGVVRPPNVALHPVITL